MRRRDFVRLAGMGMTAGAAVASDAAARAASQEDTGARRPAPLKQTSMKVGTQHDSSDEVLGVLAALGVDHICSKLPSARFDEAWSVDGLMRLREHAGHGAAAP
jgi:hypothetical protein